MATNLIFDERQRNMIPQHNLARNTEATEASRNQLTNSYDSWSETCKTHLETYETQRLPSTTPLPQVTTWNQHGETPSHVFHDLKRKRVQLNALKHESQDTHLYLKDLFRMLQTMRKKSHEPIAVGNDRAQTYNPLCGNNMCFHKGEYNGETMTIYNSRIITDLVLVLTP